MALEGNGPGEAGVDEPAVGVARAGGNGPDDGGTDGEEVGAAGAGDGGFASIVAGAAVTGGFTSVAAGAAAAGGAGGGGGTGSAVGEGAGAETGPATGAAAGADGPLVEAGPSASAADGCCVAGEGAAGLAARGADPLKPRKYTTRPIPTSTTKPALPRSANSLVRLRRSTRSGECGDGLPAGRAPGMRTTWPQAGHLARRPAYSSLKWYSFPHAQRATIGMTSPLLRARATDLESLSGHKAPSGILG